MAKKKLARQPQEDPKEQKLQGKNPVTVTHQQSAMDDPQDKFQNLKSLNNMLLKETIERRQQVESLQQAKDGLESELTRTGSEMAGLEDELTLAGEETMSLEIEKGVFEVFLKTSVSEMGAAVDGLVREKEERENEVGLLKTEVDGLMVNIENEREKLSRVCQERDFLWVDINKFEKEANGLKERVIQMEEKEKKSGEEIRNLKNQYSELVLQKQEREEKLEEVKRLRNDMEILFKEKASEVIELNVSMEAVLWKKDEIERENFEQNVKIGELEKEVTDLNEIVFSLRREEGILLEKVLELEKYYGEASEKVEVVSMEIDALVEEKREMQKTIERLMEEMDSTEKLVKTLNVMVKDKDELIDKLIGEKKEIEDVKVSKEGEIVELHKELDRLRDAVFEMQVSIKNQNDENKQLGSEVSHYRDAFEKMRFERDNVQVDLDKETKNGIILTSKVLEMEKKIEERVKEAAKMKSEHEYLLEEKKELECQFGLLKKESDLVQKNLLEAQREIVDLRNKIESSRINSERALAMLKNTAASLCQSDDGKEEVSETEKKLDGEVEPHSTELEVIRRAFRNKETMLKNMKQQVKFLQNSVADAHKKKGLWAIVSSATTVLAAASVAYLARVR